MPTNVSRSKIAHVRFGGVAHYRILKGPGSEWNGTIHRRVKTTVLTKGGGRSPSPTAASFIRPTRIPDHPRSFLDAVREKYAPASSIRPPANPEADPAEVFAQRVLSAAAAEDARVRAQLEPQRPVRFGTKIAEGVGFDKIAAQQSNLAGLRVIAVERWRVCGIVSTEDFPTADPSKGAFEPGWWDKRKHAVAEIRETLPKVTELDLRNNILELWSDVVAICAALPQLKTLRLSGNIIRSYEYQPEVEFYNLAFTKVTELALDAVHVSWNMLNDMMSCFPSLKTVSVGGNRLESLSGEPKCRSIQTMSFNNNAFTSLAQLEPLTSLPALESLTLQSNVIHSLDPCPAFPLLKNLDLSDNAIASIESLNPLCPPKSSATHALPSLESIRLSSNPFFTALPEDTAHMLTLARLPTVTKLNFSRISPEERTNAELYYVSKVSSQLEGTSVGSAAEAQILATNPLWADLCAKYERDPHPQRSSLAAGEFAPGTLGARLLKLQLRAPRTALTHYFSKRGVLPRAQIQGIAVAVGDESVRSESAADGELQLDGEWVRGALRVSRVQSVYALLGAVAEVFGVLPHRMRLVWETGEWDPVGRRGGDEDMWSVSSDDELDQNAEKGTWVRREVEIEPGTSSVGFWIDGGEADVRIDIIDSEESPHT